MNVFNSSAFATQEVVVGFDVGLEPGGIACEVYLARQTRIDKSVKAVIDRCARCPGIMAVDGSVDLIDSGVRWMFEQVLKNRIALRGATHSVSTEGIGNAGPRRLHSEFRLILILYAVNRITTRC